MLEPPRRSAEAPYTPCSLCGGVFPVGSMRFAVLQQPRMSAEAPCTPCFPCKEVAREGSVQSNHQTNYSVTGSREEVMYLTCETQLMWV